MVMWEGRRPGLPAGSLQTRPRGLRGAIGVCVSMDFGAEPQGKEGVNRHGRWLSMVVQKHDGICVGWTLLLDGSASDKQTSLRETPTP